LVIEICVTTHGYDRSKLRAYASGSVKECWLVLGPEKQIEVYTEPKSSSFARKMAHGPGGKLASQAVPEFALDLEAFFKE
jgi:Uma2 family endonuclease